jgi:short-subunit dehydrogenase
VGQGLAKDFNVQYRTVVADLSQEGFLDKLAEATNDLDIGLVVSNAGTPNPGEFLKLDRQLLQATLRLNTMAHLDITDHFGAKLAERRRGGLILIGSMGAEIRVPFLANEVAPRRMSTVSGKRSTTSSSLGASTLQSCRPR